MKIAVFGSTVSNEFFPVIHEFFDFLEKNQVEMQIYKPFKGFIFEKMGLKYPYLTEFRSHKDFNPENRLIFSVGGDGTFLKSVLTIRNFDIPVVGINSGRLGFLADISKEQINMALTNIFNSNYSILERSLLQVEMDGRENMDFNFALNEMTVMKSNTSSMINILTYLDDEFLNNYWADGLIIATPTGSTAYSLSAGGPILTPDSENFIITPLAPHGLTIRPIVVPDNSLIRLKVEGRGNQFLTSLDSRSVATGFSTTIQIRKANFKLKTLQLPDHNFFNTLRNKLMWGADKRN